MSVYITSKNLYSYIAPLFPRSLASYLVLPYSIKQNRTVTQSEEIANRSQSALTSIVTRSVT